jgi:hypothetical protein
LGIRTGHVSASSGPGFVSGGSSVTRSSHQDWVTNVPQWQSTAPSSDR